MKTRQLLLLPLALIALAFTACTSVPSITPAQGAAAVRVSVATSATLALSHNPSYVPAAQALVTGIDAAFTAQTVLTSDAIATIVGGICTKQNLPPADAAVFIVLAQSVYTAYVEEFRPTVVSTIDPQVQLYLGAFKNGLSDAVSAVAAANR